MEQGTNFLPYIITGLVMMVVGWIMGFFDSNMRTSKKIKQSEESAQAAIKEAQYKIAQAEQKLTNGAPTPIQVDDPGLFRIRSENGMLTLDIDGARVDTTALTNDQRKRLIEMLTVVRPWLEGKPAPVPAPPPPAPPTQPKPAPVISAAAAPKPVPATTPLASTPRPSVLAKDDRPVAPAGSIVSQIDSILQQRLVGTPLEERGIFLAQSPEGGVMVYIGLTKYMGLDDVPDPEVKAAIRAAISEWENKYTPGL